MSDNATQLLRVACVIVPGAVLLGTALLVLWVYSRAYQIERKVFVAQHRPRRGLLPFHVAAVVLSYFVAIMRDVVESAFRIMHHRPIGWTTVSWNLVELLLGIIALWSVLTFERKRYQHVIAHLS